MVNIGNSWDELLKEEFEKQYYLDIRSFLKKEYFSKTIYPHMNDIFNALKFTAYEDVKVVILGQDPYHGPNQAHGLAFSVKPGVATPPSLLNIYKELGTDIAGFQMPNHGYLVKWAEQGVLLLNTVLTVERGLAHSHANLGWEAFTDRVIAAVNTHRQNVVFLLWGSHAQKKGQFIDRTRHLVLTAAHPSPLSAYRGFFGCRHFSHTNAYLRQHDMSEIDWQV